MRLRPHLALEQTSFEEMVDSFDPSTGRPRAAQLLQNVYPVDTARGAAIVGRPGFRQAGSQLGVTNRRTQAIFQFTKLDGTEYTVAFAGGLMYTFNWTTRAWTNIPLVGVALPTAGQVFCVTFTDQLIVNPNDGTNKPWMWDGTTFTSLTNAPLAYGAPAIYYGKLFLIKWAARTTLVWSEENAANTGYEAGGFNNAWQLGQTNQERLEAIYGTNAALYYWRARSAGEIRGAVTTDFASTGTHDAASAVVGTNSPAAVVDSGGYVYFLSSDGKPHFLGAGTGVLPTWAGLRETVATLPRQQLSKALGCYDPQTDLVLLGVAAANETEVTLLFALRSGEAPRIAGVFEGFTPTALAIVKDGALVPTVMHGSANGYIYDHGTPNGNLWQDENNAADGGTLAISHVVKGSPMGWNTTLEHHFDRIDLSFRVLSDLTTMQLDYETPYGTGTPLNANLADGGFPNWDVSLWDTDSWAPNAVERHLAIGLGGHGRWIAPRLRHAFSDERFGLLGWVVTAIPDSTSPRIR